MNEPLWLSVARAFEGVSEVAGPGSNPVILKWARDIHAPSWYDDDDKAWCAVWMNRMCLAMQWALSGKDFELIRAKSFETWGRPLITAVLGAVLVFQREGGGHVGFYLGERPDAYLVLGGNTSNKVSATWIAKDRLTAIRWPDDVPAFSWGPVLLTGTGALSTNEA